MASKSKNTTKGAIEAKEPVNILDMVKEGAEGSQETGTVTTGAELQGNENAGTENTEGTDGTATGEALQQNTATEQAGTSDKLAAMLANATAQAQQQNAEVAPNTTKPAAGTPRAAATTRKIQSARSTDAQGNKVRRFNSTEKRRQIVSIVSEMGMLAHITTDINYAVRTPEAAKAKAYAELVKQAEIKAICAYPDIVVHVTAEDYSIDPLPGHELAECQEAKTAMYDQWKAKGYTMLGRVRRSKVPTTMPTAIAQQQAQVQEQQAPQDLKAAIAEAKAKQEAEEAAKVQETATAEDVDAASAAEQAETAEKEAVSE